MYLLKVNVVLVVSKVNCKFEKFSPTKAGTTITEEKNKILNISD